MKSHHEVKDLNIHTLGYHIDRTLSAMVKILNKELKKEGLELQHSHFSIMKVLNEVDNISQSELSKYVGKDRGSISRALNFLESNNYVERHSVNGCKNGISLTEKGREIMPLLNTISSRVTDKAFTGFREKTRKNILETLSKIYYNSSHY